MFRLTRIATASTEPHIAQKKTTRTNETRRERERMEKDDCMKRKIHVNNKQRRWFWFWLGLKSTISIAEKHSFFICICSWICVRVCITYKWERSGFESNHRGEKSHKIVYCYFICGYANLKNVSTTYGLMHSSPLSLSHYISLPLSRCFFFSFRLSLFSVASAVLLWQIYHLIWCCVVSFPTGMIYCNFLLGALLSLILSTHSPSPSPSKILFLHFHTLMLQCVASPSCHFSLVCSFCCCCFHSMRPSRL